MLVLILSNFARLQVECCSTILLNVFSAFQYDLALTCWSLWKVRVNKTFHGLFNDAEKII